MSIMQLMQIKRRAVENK